VIRAEFRLSLRPDNADLRLTPVGLKLGLVGTQRAASFATRQQGVEDVEAALDLVRGSTHAWRRQGINVSDDGNVLSAGDLMTRSDLTLDIVSMSSLPLPRVFRGGGGVEVVECVSFGEG
jgi:tRNA uridine 5-carboxymethylaminomethyl modification enzyme